jgi:Domain of unknown function (DUF4258)
MDSARIIPVDPLDFICQCLNEGHVLWTYHVNMRMKNRFISRQMIYESVENFEIIESYPEDKYFPSYLVYSRYQNTVFHVLFAVDVANMNVRVITAYQPNTTEWTRDFKRRKK